MSKNGKSIAGRLFYTFGTLFIAAIFAVFAINFEKDARVFQEPLLSASTVNTAAEKEKTQTKTLKFKKSTTATATKGKSTANEVDKADADKTDADTAQEATPDVSKNNMGNNP